eukprot:2518893-Pyramimonas_sp.AAC.1
MACVYAPKQVQTKGGVPCSAPAVKLRRSSHLGASSSRGSTKEHTCSLLLGRFARYGVVRNNIRCKCVEYRPPSFISFLVRLDLP